jgi:protein-tyrosine phosphatase
MGEYILKDMAAKAGRSEEFFIASAAVSTEEIGNPVYPPARRELARHGITCEGHHARQITRKDLDTFDRIYYMDRSNARWLKSLFPGKWERKCRPLLDRDVADPWYTGDFAATWNDITEGCTRILEEL